MDCNIPMFEIDDDIVRQYQEDGFVIVSDVFSDCELEDFRKAAEIIVRNRLERAIHSGFVPSVNVPEDAILEQAPMVLSGYDPDEYASLYDAMTQLPSFMRMVSKQKVEALANAFLEREEKAPLYGNINRCRINLPNDASARIGWHREIFQTIPNTNFTQIWAPLIHPSSSGNGAIQMCARSHTAKLPKPPWQENANGVSKVTFEPEVAKKFQILDMNLELG